MAKPKLTLIQGGLSDQYKGAAADDALSFLVTGDLIDTRALVSGASGATADGVTYGDLQNDPDEYFYLLRPL